MVVEMVYKNEKNVIMIFEMLQIRFRRPILARIKG